MSIPTFASPAPDLVEHRLLGVRCHSLTMSQAAGLVADAVDRGRAATVLFVNASKVVSARDDERLRACLESADIVPADGQSVVWASKLLRRPVPERVPGVELMQQVLALAGERRWRVYFLGATEQVLRGVREVCAERYPGAIVAGTHDGYFDDAQAAGVFAEVRAAEPDVVLVGMPSPRKEYILGERRAELGGGVAIGVGGSFDVLAGHVRRAPLAWQKVGLEWAWRLVQEPRRLWRRYLTTNLAFLTLLMRELLAPAPAPALPDAARPQLAPPG